MYDPTGTTPKLNLPFSSVVARAAGLPPGFFPSLTSTPLRGAPVVLSGPFCNTGAAAGLLFALINVEGRHNVTSANAEKIRTGDGFLSNMRILLVRRIGKAHSHKMRVLV